MQDPPVLAYRSEDGSVGTRNIMGAPLDKGEAAVRYPFRVPRVVGMPMDDGLHARRSRGVSAIEESSHCSVVRYVQRTAILLQTCNMYEHRQVGTG